MTALTTLDTLKAELGIIGTADDARLTRLIRQVSAAIELHLDRQLERQVVTDVFSHWSSSLYLSAWPVIGTPVITHDGTTWDAADYILNPRYGILSSPLYGVGYGSPCGYRFPVNTTVVYTAGYILPGDEDADLPDDIERACLDLAIRYFHAGGRDPTLRSETVPGVIEQSWTSSDNVRTIGGLPEDIARALFPHQRAVL